MLRKRATIGLLVATTGASLLLFAMAGSRAGLSLNTVADREQPGRAVVDNPTEAEIVTLQPWGFEPKEISRPPGPFFLAVDNQSGLPELDVSLESETRQKLHDVGVSKNKGRWRKKIALTPGTYLLREAGHPEWVCRITVQP